MDFSKKSSDFPRHCPESELGWAGTITPNFGPASSSSQQSSAPFLQPPDNPRRSARIAYNPISSFFPYAPTTTRHGQTLTTPRPEDAAYRHLLTTRRRRQASSSPSLPPHPSTPEQSVPLYRSTGVPPLFSPVPAHSSNETHTSRPTVPLPRNAYLQDINHDVPQPSSPQNVDYVPSPLLVETPPRRTCGRQFSVGRSPCSPPTISSLSPSHPLPSKEEEEEKAPRISRQPRRNQTDEQMLAWFSNAEQELVKAVDRVRERNRRWTEAMEKCNTQAKSYPLGIPQEQPDPDPQESPSLKPREVPLSPLPLSPLTCRRRVEAEVAQEGLKTARRPPVEAHKEKLSALGKKSEEEGDGEEKGSEKQEEDGFEGVDVNDSGSDSDEWEIVEGEKLK